MTLSEALAQGTMTAVVGLATVFAVLIILMLVIIAMEKIFTAQKPEKEQIPANEPKKVETAKNPAAAPASAQEDDEELIAVLTAAVAASLNTSVYNLRIKSYRKIETNSTAWNRAGVREVINSREM